MRKLLLTLAISVAATVSTPILANTQDKNDTGWYRSSENYFSFYVKSNEYKGVQFLMQSNELSGAPSFKLIFNSSDCTSETKSSQQSIININAEKIKSEVACNGKGLVNIYPTTTEGTEVIAKAFKYSSNKLVTVVMNKNKPSDILHFSSIGFNPYYDEAKKDSQEAK